MGKAWRNLCRLWKFARQVLAVHELLDWTGWGKPVVAAIAAIPGCFVGAWARFAYQLSLPVVVVLGLVVFAVVFTLVVVVWSFARAQRVYRIEANVNSEDEKKLNDELIEEYSREHPDVASLVKGGMMPRELAGKVQAWMQNRLHEKGLPGSIRLIDTIQPPAGIRIQDAERLIVSGNDLDVDPGISGIDTQRIKDTSITGNKVRIHYAPNDGREKT